MSLEIYFEKEVEGKNKMDGTKLLGFILLIIGMIVILITLAIRYSRRKKCTIVVQAKLIKYNSYYNGPTKPTIYIPCYSYVYNNITYKFEDTRSRSDMTEKITKKIYINPNNPNEIFQEFSVSRVIFIALGISLIAFGLRNIHLRIKSY